MRAILPRLAVQLNRAGRGLLIEGSGLLELLRFAEYIGARSAGLEPATFSARSNPPSQTEADVEGQGETKQRFYQKSRSLRRTGRDRERHPIAVKI